MKSLLLVTLILFAAGNMFSQSAPSKERSAKKAKKEKVEEVPRPMTLESKEGDDEGVDVELMEPPPPPVTSLPTYHPTANDEQPFDYVEKMPVFPGGQEAMYKFIYENLKYPDLAKQNMISGQVILQFVISSDGTVNNAKVVRGIGGGCNEEALRVINAMPAWTPGTHNGRAVPVKFTFPIKFVYQ
jgi:protein TonB